MPSTEPSAETSTLSRQVWRRLCSQKMQAWVSGG